VRLAHLHTSYLQPFTPAEQTIMPMPKFTSEIKLQVDVIVARFNVEQLNGQSCAHYVTNYRGSHLYLGHQHGGR
jgi:hypothetical protein